MFSSQKRVGGGRGGGMERGKEKRLLEELQV